MKNLNQEISLSCIDHDYHFLLDDEKMKTVVKLKQLTEIINEITNKNPADELITDIITDNIISGEVLYQKIFNKDGYSHIELYNDLENYFVNIFNSIEQKYLKIGYYIYQFDDVNELLDFLRFKACYSLVTILSIEKAINVNLKKK